nr:hypothetical protein GCM10025732_06760 [Glycomyces mayteni]
MVRVTVEAETPVSPVSGETLSKSDAERIAGVLKALADPNRLQLISLIQAAPEQEACVAELTEPLGLSQPTVSHHLRILAEAGSSSATSAGCGPTSASSPRRCGSSPTC